MIYDFVSQTTFPASLMLIVVLYVHLRLANKRRIAAEARAEQLRQVLQNGVILNADKEHPVLLIDTANTSPLDVTPKPVKPSPLPTARIHRVRFAVVEDLR